MMEKEQILEFPYDFEEITPEEQKQVQKNYKTACRFVRVGPKGFIVYEPYKIDAANIYNMAVRPTDIFVATFQRSGTTLTQELVWLLANNFDYTTAAEVPLTIRYPFLDAFQFVDLSRIDILMEAIGADPHDQNIRNLITMVGQPATGILGTMTSPRFIKTHLPMSLLNPKLLDTAKVVYVARDPRDVVVSSYHHARLFKMIQFTGDFKEFWNMFYKGLFVLCPIIEHVKEAWELRHHPNMLFLFYEELSKDLPASIRCIAKFLDKEINQEQIDRLCDHLSIEKFKKNQSVNYEELREYGLLANDETFVRKGKSGGWRDYFDNDMTQQAEQWIIDSLKDTDLRYPNMDYY